MSRSHRHTPITGITCSKSDKPGKVKANRALRASTRPVLGNCADYDDLAMPLLREVSSAWSFPKDGKQYMKNRHASWYRKCMRK